MIVAAGCVLLLMGVFGKIGAAFATIPTPVIGGMFLVMFGVITAVGISNLQVSLWESSGSASPAGSPRGSRGMEQGWGGRGEGHLWSQKPHWARVEERNSSRRPNCSLAKRSRLNGVIQPTQLPRSSGNQAGLVRRRVLL